MGPKFLCKRYISLKINAKQIQKIIVDEQFLKIRISISIDTDDRSYLFWEILDGGIKFGHEVSNLRSITSRQKCKSTWSNISSALISIRAFLSLRKFRIVAILFYSLFYSRIELDQFPARKSDRNDIESLSSRATSSFCVTLGKVGHLFLGHPVENQFPRRITPALSIMRGTRSRSR